MPTRLGIAALLLMPIFACQTAVADDFRVETKLFIDKDATQPDSTNVTYFQQGRVYDFLTRTTTGGKSDTVVSIYDAPKGRFVLIDTARKVQAEISRDRLAEMTGSLRTRAAQQTDALIKFAAEPKFTELAGKQEDETTFGSPVLNYRVVAFSPPSSEASRQYREFTDAYARLNAITNPGSMLPFPRMAVNEALAKKNTVPREVERTIHARNKLLGKAIVHRTAHSYHWSLAEADEDRILQAKRWQVEFSPVSLGEYIHPEQ